MDSKDTLVVFEDKKIRRTWNNNEWWFVLEDIVYILTDSSNPKQYIQKMKQRDEPLAKGWVQIVHTLEIETAGGKQKMNCVNTEGAFRIIQSIPSQKAEPFKKWLAKIGYERIQEIEDPELAQIRMKETYKLKGYSDEWDKRGIKSKQDYSILTAEISRATFDLTPGEYKKLKGLKNENLRDHMDDLELILTMLGEATTTRFTRDRDSQKFPDLRKDAKDGGDVAGATRKDIEGKLGNSVVSSDNYLGTPEKMKRIENKRKSKLMEV